MTKKVFNLAGGKHSDASYAAFENRQFGSVKASIASFLVSAGTGMQAVVSSGDGLIATGNASGARRIQSTANENVTVSAASASFNRLDTVVAYIDTAVTPTTGVVDNTNNVLMFACVAGTAAASPAAPSDATIQSAIGAGNPFLRLANILVPQNATNLSGATFTDIAPVPSYINGWQTLTGAFAYSAWDNTNKVATITVPDSTIFTLGQKFRYYQSTGGWKYGFIVRKPNGTSIQVYQGHTNGYTLNNEAVFLASSSRVKAPDGFPLDPAVWTVEYTSTSNQSQSNPVIGTWYNIGSAQLSVPIGVWDLEYEVNVYNSATAGASSPFTTLSTANNNESNIRFTNRGPYASVTAGAVSTLGYSRRHNLISQTANTTYYLNAKIDTGTVSTINYFNTNSTLIIRAVCAYL